MSKKILFLAMLLTALGLGLSAQTLTIRTVYEDSAPKFIQGSDAKFSGLCVELLELIAKEANLKIDVPTAFVPKKRSQSLLETGEIDLLMGVKKDLEREKIYNFGEALYPVNYLILVAKGDTVDIKDLSDFKSLAKAAPVLTVKGAASVAYLQGLGLTVDDGGADVESNIKKLAARRAKFFVYQNISTVYALKAGGMAGDVVILPFNLDEYFQHIAYSKNVDPQIVKRISAAIKKLKDGKEWTAIVAKYL